jgi:hypothetical protein
MARSAWFVNNLSNGQFVVEDMCLSSGARWFVSSGTGSDSSGYGKSPDTPVATIDYAIGLATASKGDLILVMPGHAETLSSAGAITADKIGLTIRGLGQGSNRPTLSFANTAATFAISAAGTTVQNIRVTSTVDEMVKMFHVTGAYCTIDDVEHFETSSCQTLQFLLTTNAADYLTVKNCFHYQMTAAAATQKWIELVGTDCTRIIDNTFYLTLRNETASHTISGSTAVVNCEIGRNVFLQLGGVTQNTVVNLVTTSTGFIHDNRAYSSTGVSTASAFTGDACGFAENYWADTAAASGLLAPGVDTDT